MTRNIFIHSFEPVLPEHHLSQAETIRWILDSHRKSASLRGEELDENKLLRYILNDKHIQTRYFECEDVDTNWEEHQIYKLTAGTPSGSSFGIRNEFFAKRALSVFRKLYRDKTPAHVVHVTCTGYVSPSPPQVYFNSLKKTPEVTHAYHMGCYAALPSTRMAMGLHLLRGESVDVVHTEMCSLHLDPTTNTPEQLVVQSLFADGHIKYSIGPDAVGMRILQIKEKIIPDTLEDMGWIPDAFGMKMVLSREVPFKIRDSLPEFIFELCEKAGLDRGKVLERGMFAIHPGGPKIIEAVQKKLELRDDQVALSQKVLFERGNMSSATLPHVWNEILKTSPEKGTIVLSLAFGPGLTIFGSLFEVV